MFDPSTRILIADDMATMRKVVTKVCKEAGFNDITEAADGNQAWDALLNANPPIGVILSDWNMPNCTGLELLKRVRADHRLKKTPFILVTAEAEKHQIMEAVKAGVDQYVVKPFSKDDLNAKLEAVHKKYTSK
jgi:two-component system chemotaxis response regulator CheY